MQNAEKKTKSAAGICTAIHRTRQITITENF
jgi:hypothetical protein